MELRRAGIASHHAHDKQARKEEKRWDLSFWAISWEFI